MTISKIGFAKPAASSRMDQHKQFSMIQKSNYLDRDQVDIKIMIL